MCSAHLTADPQHQHEAAQGGGPGVAGGHLDGCGEPGAGLVEDLLRVVPGPGEDREGLPLPGPAE